LHGIPCRISSWIDLLSSDPDIAKIFDRTAIEKVLGTANDLGNCGPMVYRFLSGRGD
jgi:hypothetical protein